jgi:2-methylcitrate dehydratase PrpD
MPSMTNVEESVIKKPAVGSAPAATQSQMLAAFASSLRHEDIPADVLDKAKDHMLDAFGIALASTDFDYAGRTRAAVKALGGTGGATSLAFGDPLPPADAALINGVLIHGLDFDDTHVAAIYHATAPALAAVLPAAQVSGASAREMLVAFVIALEIGCRIAKASEGKFHDRRFHPTALAGTFAATYAVGRLLGLTSEQMVSAASLAGSEAAGILETEGSWLKRYHPGWAAHAGYVAAVMAQHGFIGADTVFEGNAGFYQTHLGYVPSEELLPAFRLGEAWEIRGIALKPYPCCHFIHAFVDAAIALRDQVEVADIERIDCPLTDRLHKMVGEPRDVRIKPRNSYDAMFSVPYVTALGLVKGEVDLASFHDLGVDDPEILALAAKTFIEPDPKSDFPAHFPGEVRITMRDGKVVSRRETTSTGTPDRPLSRREVEAKFLKNACRVVPREQAEKIIEAVMAIDKASDITHLTRSLVL